MIWLQALPQCVLDSFPTWKPSPFLVDDALVEVQVIRCVDLLLCLSFISMCIYIISNCSPKYCSRRFIHSDVFSYPIMLYIWHLHHCWLKKLTKYIHNTKTKIEMSKSLGNIMHYSLLIEHATNRLQKFYGMFS